MLWNNLIDLFRNHSEVYYFDSRGALHAQNIIIVRVKLDITNFYWLWVLYFERRFLGLALVPDVYLVLVWTRNKQILWLWHPQHVLYVPLLMENVPSWPLTENTDFGEFWLTSYTNTNPLVVPHATRSLPYLFQASSLTQTFVMEAFLCLLIVLRHSNQYYF